MGFGSYDESEQENQEFDTEDIGDDNVETEENAHDGSVSYEFEASNDELLDQLESIKDE